MKSIPKLLILALTLSMLNFAGCASKKKANDFSDDSSSASSSDINGDLSDSDSGRAMGLQTVHYAYDSSTLDQQAKEQLNANAEVMKENKSLKVQIEGHTDSRGGIQYNIALGERRAQAARAFLKSKGIANNRMTILSYGKEKPVAMGEDESSWSQNRRANFRITDK